MKEKIIRKPQFVIFRAINPDEENSAFTRIKGMLKEENPL
jgi:hypothetical protein